MGLNSFNLLLWSVIIILTITTSILLLIIAYIISVYNNFFSEYTNNFKLFCENHPSIVYREEVYIPSESGVYEKKLATALVDIAYNTSTANCNNILPIPNPPGFTNQLRIEGVEPLSGEILMFAYIYWDYKLSHAVMSFTGTEFLSEWRSDLQYQQIAPTSLNGYKDGVLVHKGFYNIYMAIRDKLWDWWNQNNSWVKTLYITGHSLGGALSTICGYDFANELPIHYSFAAPRSGNTIYAEEFNKRLPTSLRINNTEDIIPALPPATFQTYTYEHTIGNVPFTISLGSLSDDHIKAYYDYLPECPQVAKCHI